MTSKSAPTGIPPAAIVAFGVMALLAVGMVLFAIFGLSDTPPQPAVPPTTEGRLQPSLPPATFPTVTSQPPAPASAVPVAQTVPATQAAPASEPAPTLPPTAAQGATLKVGEVVNIRSGPGTTYPIIGGLQAGAEVPVLGRDTTSNWYAVNNAGGAQGQGWVARAVVSFSGDAASLPIMTAAAPPPAAPPAVPPTAVPAAAPTNPPPPPPPASGHGIVGTLNLCEGRTTYGVNERICVVEKIFNSTNTNVDYGILGVNAANLSGGQGWFQSSWTGTLTLAPNCTGPVGTCGGQWEDGFKLASAGTYQFTLSICYSNVTTCQAGGSWETLTAPITVVVQ
jgi:uncharacterized protein YraI